MGTEYVVVMDYSQKCVRVFNIKKRTRSEKLTSEVIEQFLFEEKGFDSSEVDWMVVDKLVIEVM
jgi:hypothetical protein